MSRDLVLAETILNKGGTTQVPEKVMEALGLKPKRGERSKLLWTPAGDEVIVTKGTPQSDWRKTMLRRNGRRPQTHSRSFEAEDHSPRSGEVALDKEG